MNTNNTNDIKTSSSIFSTNLKNIKSRGTSILFGASTLWFSFFVGLIFIGSSFTKLVFTTNNTAALITYIISGIFSSVFIFVLLIWGRKINFWVLLPLSSVLSLSLGFSVLGPILFSFLLTASAYKLLGILGIATALFILIGILGYFNLLQIQKIWPFLLIVASAMFILFITSFFIVKSWVISLYGLLGMFLGIVYLMFDFALINNESAYVDGFLNSEIGNQKSNHHLEIARISLWYGFKLAYDYLILVYYLIRIIGYFRS
ncbi:MAG0110 family membrane protein [Mycoplasmopsis gallinarum]|uniref:MAG0110 family membrane protein n=1 Tax=Mycoplasmopsis gallinarum TaxID=29557 RepID=UPI0005671B3E|nr:hypothetical protein [Mycoplasmopsis gallinarum]